MASRAKQQARSVKGRGRAARNSVKKNMECVDEFLTLLEENTSVLSLQTALQKEGYTLGRVISMAGAGRLNVVALDFDTFKHGEAQVPVAGSLKFKGHASGGKSSLPFCMMSGDIIVIRGGFASGKMGSALADSLGEKLSTLGIPIPRGFFSSVRHIDIDIEEEDDGIEFDRSEERAEAMKEIAMIREQTKSKSKMPTAEESDLDIDAI